MHFLPTKPMCLAAAMRQTLSERIARVGENKKHLHLLREIYLFEGRAGAKDFSGVYNLKEIIEKIFLATVFSRAVEGKFIFCRVSGEGCYRTNLRIFELAVCAFAAAAEDGAVLELRCDRNFLRLGILGSHKSFDTRALKLLGGVVMKRVGERGVFIFFSLEMVSESLSQKVKTEYLLDRYSVLNVFLLD